MIKRKSPSPDVLQIAEISIAENPQERFEQTINRAKKLIIKSAAFSSNVEDEKITADDMARLAVVLAIAALESFVIDSFCAYFLNYIRRFGVNKRLEKTLSDCLKIVNPHARLTAGDLLMMDKPHAKIKLLVRYFFEKQLSSPSKKIDAIFDLYEIENITRIAEEKSKRSTLIASINRLGTMRNQIIHDGHYHARGNRLDSIRVTDIEKKINNISLFIRHLKESIEDRMREEPLDKKTHKKSS